MAINIGIGIYISKGRLKKKPIISDEYLILDIGKLDINKLL